MNLQPGKLFRRPASLLAGAALLSALLWLALAVHGAVNKSPVVDEIAHFGDGLAMWRYGDARMNPEHPPLFKMLATLPVEILAPREMSLGDEHMEFGPWVDFHQWRWGYYLLYLEEEGRHGLLVFLMRIVPILTGLLGGVVAFFWGREFGGTVAGLLAAVFLLYYPEYLGHARFLTLDVPMLVACGAITLAGWAWWKNPDWKRTALLVGAGAILPLVKLPVGVYLILLLGTMACILVHKSVRGVGTGGRGRRFMLMLALLVPAIYMAQWASAGFRFSLYSEHDQPAAPHYFVRFQPPYEDPLEGLLAFTHRHRLLPEASIAVLNHSRSFGGRTMFLLGEERSGGWLHYFFVTILLKTPLVYFLGLVPAFLLLGRQWRGGQTIQRERALLLLVPFLVLFLIFMLGRANLGHRYVLFLYLPWAALLGWAASDWIVRGGWRYAVALAAAVFLVVQAIAAHPNQATWFNIIGGSPWQARHALEDSNIDWGQDLPALGRKLEELGNPPLNLAYFGAARFEAYTGASTLHIVPVCDYVPEDTPAVSPIAEWHSAISLNCLRRVKLVYPGRFDREPLAVLNSIALFAPEEP